MSENKTKYTQLAEDIRQLIQDKELTVGMQIPSENQLSRQYQVSRQTVRKAIAELIEEGYVQPEHGRGTFVADREKHFSHSAHTGHSGNIAVVTTYFSDYIFPRVIQGIDKVLSENGYSILLKTTGNSRAAEARCMEELLSKDIDGMIIEPSKSQIYCRHTSLYEQMDEYGIPYVFIQGVLGQLAEKPQVLMNDKKGGYLITKYLINTGHKSIAGVFKADDMQGQERHKGYVQALTEAGIWYDPDKVIWFHTEDRAMKPHDAIGQLMFKNIDAVVCYNDQVAVDVIRGLSEIGKKVPEDISVTGFDNSLVAKNYRIPLTTMSHPQEKLGMEAGTLLVKLLKGQNLTKEETQIKMDQELIIRESTKVRSV